MTDRFIIGACALAFMAIAPLSASADSAHDDAQNQRSTQGFGFARFVADFRKTAVSNGIPGAFYDTHMAAITPNPTVTKLANNQPEFNTPIWTYIDTRVSAKRISNGKAMAKQHAALFKAIEQRFQVDRHILLAIWGMETSYGTNKGNLGVLRSLATMGFKGRRAKFGRTQLIAALKILHRGDITASAFNGSWAGAMGHTQFIPTTYNLYAVDWTGDGKRDVWNSLGDAVASAANYLSKRGWKPGRPWGWEVKLPKGFDYRRASPKKLLTIAKWKTEGVRRADGKSFTSLDQQARIMIPAGARGPAFLVTDNFKAILAYNASISYALSVGHLADRIKGRQAFKSAWPRQDRQLSVSERRELQELLTARGFDTGGTNGYFGRKTLAAVRAYQVKLGLPPDGYASITFLNRVKATPK